MTGQGKFSDKKASATHMMKFGEDGSREEYIRNRDDYVEELLEVIAKYNEQ